MSIIGGPNVIDNSLILYLDSANPKSYIGSGNDFYDLSKTNNNATLFNGPTFTTENQGGIVTDGADDSIYILNNSTISSFTTGLTVSVWAKALSLGDYNFLMGKPTDDNWNDGFGMYFESNFFYFFVNDWAAYRAGASLGGNSFGPTNWVGVYNGASVLFYRNGVLFGSTSLTGNVANTTSSLTFCNSPSNNYPMAATLYNASVYNRVLTQKEIVQNFNVLKGRFKL